MSMSHGSAAKTPKAAMGLELQSSQYGSSMPVIFGQNKVPGIVLWYGDFKAIAHKQKQQGGKGGGSQTTTSYTYSASFQLAMGEGVGSIANCYNGTDTKSLAALGGISSSGTLGQAPWAHLSGLAAIGYSGTLLASFQDYALGDSPSLPNLNFEVVGRNQYGSGVLDANPADILTTICTDTAVGIHFNALGDLTQFSNYCRAAGLFFSPVYNTQQQASQPLEDLFKYANSAAWFSEGVLKVQPYGDAALTGNGATYTPNVTAVADLTANDFMTNGNSVPVRVHRTAPADARNLHRIEFKDRAYSYHTNAVTASIDQDVVDNGARSDNSDSVDMITSIATARLVAQNLLQRDYYIRNTYEFQLSWRYCYLEPMDVVTLTDTHTGLNLTPVRITEISEDEFGLLSVTAEEMPDGVGHGGSYGTQSNGHVPVNPNTDPGPIDAPYLFRAPGFLVSAGAPEIWAAVAGSGQYWAGCDVYVSNDNASFEYLTTFARESSYGYITNSITAGTDLDNTNVPNVVLHGGATLRGGNATDRDQFNTLSMIDTEVISYQTATLAAGPSYNLGSLRRGGYGTTNVSHAVNAPFVRLDENILRIPIDPSQVGSTIYLKFLSFNAFGLGGRTLAGETSYSYVVGTNVEFPDVPAVPATFTATGVADGVDLKWTNANPAAVACTSIEFATASGGPWTVLAQVGPTATGYHHAFTNGATYFYRARSRGHNIAGGWSAYATIVSATGYNTSAAVAASQADATAALAELNDIFSDSLLTPDEKPAVIRDRDTLIGEQAGIDAQATTYGVTTEKTTYDTAISALTSHLATLTTPVLWSNLAGNTNMVGATLRQKFIDAYTARTALLQKIADVVTYGNTAGSGVNMMWAEYAHPLVATLPSFSALNGAGAVSYDAANRAVGTVGGCFSATTAGTNIGEGWHCGSAATDYNMPMPPGRYIVSVLAQSNTAGHKVAFGFRHNDTTPGYLQTPDATLTSANTWYRISAMLDATSKTAMTAIVPFFWANRSGVAGRGVKFDGLMIEPAVGGLTTPSTWGPGNPTRQAINAQAAADASQAAANAAQADATSALNQLTDISSDSLLTPGEKPQVIADRDAITAEQSGIDAQATAYAITTEKTTYDNAVSALTSYLATLTSPVLWSTLTGNTNIVGVTFRQKFLDVYAARQALLNRIYQLAKSIADGKNTVFNTTSTPTANKVDDLWYNPNTLEWKRWDGSSWVSSPVNAVSANGANLIPNATFQSNKVGTPNATSLAANATATDGWMVLDPAGADAQSYVRYLSASGVLRLSVSAPPAVPNNSAVAPTVRTLSAFAVEPSTNYMLSAVTAQILNGSTTAGVTYETRAYVGWYDATGTFISYSSNLTRVRGAAAPAPLQVASPSTARSAHVFLQTYVYNASGAAWTHGNTVALATDWSSVSLIRKIDLDTFIDDGTNYGRLSNLDLYNTGGFNRLGLRFGGSGHRIGDTRNLLQLNIGNGSAKVPTVVTYSASAGTPATATISVAAWTMLSGSVSVSYGAKSVGVTGTNNTTVTYFLYLDDPTFAGTGTLVATTNGNDVFGADGRVFIGSCAVTYPSAGSGSGGGFSGGGGNSCVCLDMALFEGGIAYDARPGLILDCLDLPTGDTKFKRGIGAVRLAEAECVRIVTDAGAVLDLSASTPFDLLDGRSATADAMLNEMVVTDLGIETVVEVIRLGIRRVAKISVGGVSYAAGRDPNHRIYSHNANKP